MEKFLLLLIIISTLYSESDWERIGFASKNVLAVHNQDIFSEIFASIENDGVYGCDILGDSVPLFSLGSDTFETAIQNVCDLWMQYGNNTLYAATEKGVYYYDQNPGNQVWQRIVELPPIRFHTINSFANYEIERPEYAYAVSETEIYRMKIAGGKWELLSFPIPTNGIISCIFVKLVSSGTDTVYIGARYNNRGGVWKSLDFGNSWQECANSVEEPFRSVNGIISDHLSTSYSGIFIGCDQGLYKLNSDFSINKKLENYKISGLRFFPSFKFNGEMFICSENFEGMDITSNDFSSSHPQTFFAATSDGVYYKYYPLDLIDKYKNHKSNQHVLYRCNKLILNNTSINSVKVLNLRGQVLKSFHLKQYPKQPIDITFLKSGSYIAECLDLQGKVYLYSFTHLRK